MIITCQDGSDAALRPARWSVPLAVPKNKGEGYHSYNYQEREVITGIDYLAR